MWFRPRLARSLAVSARRVLLGLRALSNKVPVTIMAAPAPLQSSAPPSKTQSECDSAGMSENTVRSNWAQALASRAYGYFPPQALKPKSNSVKAPLRMIVNGP